MTPPRKDKNRTQTAKYEGKEEKLQNRGLVKGENFNFKEMCIIIEVAAMEEERQVKGEEIR